MQRHNELLEAIKEAPSEINTIVARRRKDFTKEFFVHLHTVAQSYHDSPAEQNGKTGSIFFLIPFDDFFFNIYFVYLIGRCLPTRKDNNVVPYQLGHLICSVM